MGTEHSPHQIGSRSVSDVQTIVAQSADVAGLHATAPALLLELQTQLGALAANATTATERGRRPFRPGAGWAARLGEVAYGVFLLADQTGVDIAREVSNAAQAIRHRAELASADQGWPFEAD